MKEFIKKHKGLHHDARMGVPSVGETRSWDGRNQLCAWLLQNKHSIEQATISPEATNYVTQDTKDIVFNSEFWKLLIEFQNYLRPVVHTIKTLQNKEECHSSVFAEFSNMIDVYENMNTTQGDIMAEKVKQRYTNHIL